MIMDKASTAGFWIHWPTPVSLTLYPKTATTDSGDTFGSTVTQSTCRQAPVDEDNLQSLHVGMNQTATAWHVWDRGQSRLPNREDVLQQADGTRWRVKKIKIQVFGNMYVCYCVSEVP